MQRIASCITPSARDFVRFCETLKISLCRPCVLQLRATDWVKVRLLPSKLCLFSSNISLNFWLIKLYPGRNSLRLKNTCGRHSRLRTQRFLLFSYLHFHVYFAFYPPKSFKIICLTCVWSKFVDTSFHSSQKPWQNIPASTSVFVSFQKIIPWS